MHLVCHGSVMTHDAQQRDRTKSEKCLRSVRQHAQACAKGILLPGNAMKPELQRMGRLKSDDFFKESYDNYIIIHVRFGNQLQSVMHWSLGSATCLSSFDFYFSLAARSNKHAWFHRSWRKNACCPWFFCGCHLSGQGIIHSYPFVATLAKRTYEHIHIHMHIQNYASYIITK